MSDDRKPEDGDDDKKPRNHAPDAVRDPNEKTEGKPGAPSPQEGDEDPGAG